MFGEFFMLRLKERMFRVTNFNLLSGFARTT